MAELAAVCSSGGVSLCDVEGEAVSGCLTRSFLLLNECVDEVDDELLLSSGKDGCLLESALQFAYGPGSSGRSDGGRAEDVFDAHAEGFGEFWEDV